MTGGSSESLGPPRGSGAGNRPQGIQGTQDSVLFFYICHRAVVSVLGLTRLSRLTTCLRLGVPILVGRGPRRVRSVGRRPTLPRGPWIPLRVTGGSPSESERGVRRDSGAPTQRETERPPSESRDWVRTSLTEGTLRPGTRPGRESGRRFRCGVQSRLS